MPIIRHKIALIVVRKYQKSSMFVGTTVLTVDAVNGGDHNAAINIKNRAVGHPVLQAQLMSQAIAGVSQKPTPYYT